MNRELFTPNTSFHLRKAQETKGLLPESLMRLSFFKRYAFMLALLLLCAVPRLWAQDTPPAYTPTLTLTVTPGKYVAFQVMVSGEGIYWVETTSGVYEKRTITDGGWSTREGFLSSGTTMKVHGKIKGFDIQNNNEDITGIDVTKCWELTILNVNNNTISALDLTKNFMLEHLTCEMNQLAVLDVSQNTRLGWLECQHNQLTSLNVSRNTQLYLLKCYSNQIFDANVFNSLYCSLRAKVSETFCKIYPALTTGDTQLSAVLASNASIAIDKGWGVFYGDGGGESITTTGGGQCMDNTPPANTPFITLNMVKDGWGVNALLMRMTSEDENTMVWIEVLPDVFHKINVGELWSGTVDIGLEYRQTLNIYGNLTSFSCRDNGEQIKGIDLNGHPALKELECSYTDVENILFGAASQLKKLSCINTPLNFTKLYCDLPTRDVSENAHILAALTETDLYIDNIYSSNSTIANEKGWTVLFMESGPITTYGTQNCDQFTPPADAKAISISLGGIPFGPPIEPTVDLVIRLKAAEENTPVWIELREGEYRFVSVGTSFSADIPLQASTNKGLKIYGDVTGLDCYDNFGIASIDLTNNAMVEELNASEINSLRGITLSPSSNMKLLSIYDSSLDVNALFCELPERNATDNAILYLLDRLDSDLTGLESWLASPEIAREKGWQVLCLEDDSDVVLPSVLTCDLLSPTANTPVVTLTLSSLPGVPDYIPGTVGINVKVKAAVDSTIIWIDGGYDVFLPMLVDTAWTSLPPIPLMGNTLKIYGDILALDCSDNQPYLRNVDINENPLLEELNISMNLIFNLDVSANFNLKKLACLEVPFGKSMYDKIYCNLPARAEGDSAVMIPVGGTAGLTDDLSESNADIAREKGWKVKYGDENSEIPTLGTITCDQLTPPADAQVISMELDLEYGDSFPFLVFGIAGTNAETPVWIEMPNGVMNTMMIGESAVPFEDVVLESGTVKIYGNVAELNVNNKMLTAINATGNDSLVKLDCANSNISSLILSQNAAFEYLRCINNRLQELDLSGCAALEYLECSLNEIEALNLSQLVNLTYLEIDNNKLTSLDISNNSMLSFLNCSHNNISELYLGEHPALTYLKLFKNNFTTAALDGIYCGLPTHESSMGAVLYAVLDRNSVDESFALATNVGNATAKGWTVLDNSPAPLVTTGTFTCGSVAGIILSHSELTMATGFEFTLEANVQPNNAADQSISWENSNAEVVSLENGKITALTPGTAIITVTTSEGGYTATCEVTVVNPIPVNTPVITLTVKENALLTDIDLIAADVDTPVWIESKPGIYTQLTVGNDWYGYFDYQAIGTTIKVYGNITTLDCRDNVNKFFGLDPTGNPMIEELWLFRNSLSFLNISQNPNLSYLSIEENRFSTNALNDIYCALPIMDGAEMYLLNDYGDKNYVATMASNVEIAKEKGWDVKYAKIPERIFTNGTYTCGSVYDIMISETVKTINVGDNHTLTAMVFPSTADNQNIAWSSDDVSVATVENGVVTGLVAGTAIISATSEDGQFTATCVVTVVNVDVTGVTLSETTKAIEVEENFTLTATVLPENAFNKNVTWSSSNPEVATVENGVVTGVAVGNATITVTTVDGEFTATCEVTVENISVTGVTLSETTKTIEVEENFTLTATVLPENAFNKNVTWSSSNTLVATVENGVVTGVAAGNATITVTTIDGEFTATCEVTVENISITGVTLSETSKTIEVEENFTLTATVLPENAFNKSVSWSSSNTEFATVENGVVTGVAAGTATITVTTVDGEFTATCEVTVVVPSYQVVVASGIEHGTIAATPGTNVEQGTEVTLVATPDNGYRLKANTLRVYKTGDESVVVEIADGKFTMPAFSVTVTGEFEQITGIDTHGVEELSLYPNPAGEQVFIQGLTAPTMVEVYSISGTRVAVQMVEPQQALNLDNIASGAYIVRVNNKSIRLIVNK